MTTADDVQVGAYPFEDPQYPNSDIRTFQASAAYFAPAVATRHCICARLPPTESCLSSAQRICAAKYRIPSRIRLSEECADLLRRIFVVDPSQRITLRGIKQHPWFLHRELPNQMQVSQRPRSQLPYCASIVSSDDRVNLESNVCCPLSLRHALTSSGLRTDAVLSQRAGGMGWRRRQRLRAAKQLCSQHADGRADPPDAAGSPAASVCNAAGVSILAAALIWQRAHLGLIFLPAASRP